MSKRQGRGWAYIGALLGGVVSIAANIAHSYVPPKGAPTDWSPHAGAVVGAVFWPVALFVAVEIFARTRWGAEAKWTTLRWLGLLPVALVAAVVSYRHLSGLLAFYGEDGLTVVIGPLAVDGLMVMATGALIATSRARVAIEPATVPTVEPVTVAAVDQAQTAPAPEPPTSDAAPTAARRPARRQSAADRVAKAAARTPAASPAQLAARLKLSERTVQRYMPRPADDTTPPSQQPSEHVNGHTPALVTAEQGGNP